MVTPVIILFAAFVLALLLGSFLNVCIARLPRSESIVRPRSRCPECGAAIRWYDNIPLLSWLLLGRHCRDCKRPIPLRYPLIELATGLWFAAVAAHCLHAFADPHVQFTTESTVTLIVTGVGIATLGFLLVRSRDFVQPTNDAAASAG